MSQQNQLAKQLEARHKSGQGSMMFWSKTKKHFQNSSASIRGFTISNGATEIDPAKMTELAVEDYEKLFGEPVVYIPHPYVDIPYDKQDDSKK
ncbi:unnamed protein product [Didymodactylos carnosus]|uniref:Uncharacterized protein n=1 Tax=Didymodactylos carnosus TaxID=1234261 RepID=A0A813TCA5_9BILA|nr:unnamed protein product [Didymodactylos carnosus]CAF0809551.1 unnamed protein product [Didymodactylos carnosus]CAF3501140.1 unnamed protein product [Didymodactylos carnosus]CAF3595107.1 unnamed protein product [Didymodactylos carnosus]